MNTTNVNISNVTMLVCSLLTVASFLIRRFTPSTTSWWHTPLGTSIILLSASLATAVTEAIMAKGLTLGVVLAAVTQALTAYVAASSPAQTAKTNPVTTPPPVPPAALLALCFLPFASACACWKADSAQYNSAGCVIARGTVQCGVAGVASAIVPIIQSATVGDVQAIADVAKRDGTAAGACLLSDLFGALPTTNAPTRLLKLDLSAGEKRKIVEDALAEWKRLHGNASVCSVYAGGERVCR